MFYRSHTIEFNAVVLHNPFILLHKPVILHEPKAHAPQRPSRGHLHVSLRVSKRGASLRLSRERFWPPSADGPHRASASCGNDGLARRGCRHRRVAPPPKAAAAEGRRGRERDRGRGGRGRDRGRGDRGANETASETETRCPGGREGLARRGLARRGCRGGLDRRGSRHYFRRAHRGEGAAERRRGREQGRGRGMDAGTLLSRRTLGERKTRCSRSRCRTRCSTGPTGPTGPTGGRGLER